MSVTSVFLDEEKERGRFKDHLPTQVVGSEHTDISVRKPLDEVKLWDRKSSSSTTGNLSSEGSSFRGTRVVRVVVPLPSTESPSWLVVSDGKGVPTYTNTPPVPVTGTEDTQPYTPKDVFRLPIPPSVLVEFLLPETTDRIVQGRGTLCPTFPPTFSLDLEP